MGHTEIHAGFRLSSRLIVFKESILTKVAGCKVCLNEASI